MVKQDFGQFNSFLFMTRLVFFLLQSNSIFLAFSSDICMFMTIFAFKKCVTSRMWWNARVVPAAWEVEAGESFEPRSSRLQCAVITSVNSHCTPDQATCLFKNKKDAQVCNPSTLGGRGGWITRSTDRDHPGQHGETPSLLKIQKKNQLDMVAPVIPATREAEAGELPDPRRRRLR